MENTLKRLFYSPAQASAYAGAYNLLRSTRKKYPPKEVLKWLEGQDAHTLHKYARRHFQRRNYNVYAPFDVWESDLVDLRSLKEYNDQMAYLLVVIDVLSKYAWVEPIPDKTCKSVAAAFERILEKCKGQQPVYFQTDMGKEFVCRYMQNVLKQKGITYRVVRSPDVKAAVVERFNRTLKGRLWRYFTHLHTRRYVDVLQNIVDAYNKSWHSGIKMAPSQVNLQNAARARQNLARRYANARFRKPKYGVGDLVRISRAKTAFAKAYEGEWSLELFKIIRINTVRQPPVYILQDLAGDKIDGFFYEEELSRVNKDLNSDVFEIDEILESKGRGRGKKYLVSWKGYPEKFNSWVSANELKHLQ